LIKRFQSVDDDYLLLKMALEEPKALADFE
jgi:hypothetical protein